MGNERFRRAVIRAVARVPTGRVASYGAIADAAGRPGAARAVGAILRGTGDGDAVPWWRVINGRGVITIPRSGHAAGLQRALLESEGVEFDGAGRVDMARFAWPREADVD